VNQAKSITSTVAHASDNIGIDIQDVSDADTETYRLFKSFINGMLSQNYDISHIFIDSLFKVVPDDKDGLEGFINALEEISNKNNVKFTICISADKSELPDSIHKYI